MAKHRPYTLLKRIFAANGIVYKDVADVINTTETTVMNKLNGHSDFYLSEAIAISMAFGIAIDYFFTDFVA